MSGTVNISRKLWADEAFKDEPLTEREAFVWLIMEASWKDRTKRVGDYVVETARGQLAASIRFMAKAWAWSPAKVNRFIKRMEKLGKIIIKTETGVTVVTICKYNDYQSAPTSSETGAKQERNRSETNENKGLIPEAIKKDTSGVPDAFGDFWAACPRKVAKGDAEKAFAKAAKKTSPTEIVRGMKQHAASVRGKDQKFIPHPATWLNGERWADEGSSGASANSNFQHAGYFGRIPERG